MAILSYPTADSSASENYRRMVSLITPRPIAWVTSENKNGVVNLAPFSFFNGVCSDPPCLSVAIARNGDGSKKDTLRNIESAREFVVHIPHDALAESVNFTSAPFPPEVSEVSAAGLTTTPSTLVGPPRIVECLAAFECQLETLVAVGGEHAGSATLVIGRILCTHVDENLLDERLRIDVRKLRPVARLGGNQWSRLGEIFTLERPHDLPIGGPKARN